VSFTKHARVQAQQRFGVFMNRTLAAHLIAQVESEDAVPDGQDHKGNGRWFCNLPDGRMVCIVLDVGTGEIVTIMTRNPRAQAAAEIRRRRRKSIPT